ncbi:MAG: adenosylcobinamide amidohydrolase [Thermoplasmata archaeon]
MVELLVKDYSLDTGNFQAKMQRELLLVQFKSAICISNAVFNGGIRQCRSVVNYSLNGKKDLEDSPVDYVRRIIKGLDVAPGDTVVLLTAVKPEKFMHSSYGRVHCFLSLGLDNAASPMDSLGYSGTGRTGTINIIVLTEVKLTEAALVDAYKTVVETKSFTLMEKGIKSVYTGNLATGTITDAAVVASLTGGEEYIYAGTGTDIGSEISKAVYSAMRTALILEATSSE